MASLHRSGVTPTRCHPQPKARGGYVFTIGCRRGYHFTIAMWYRNGRLKRLVLGFCHTCRCAHSSEWHTYMIHHRTCNPPPPALSALTAFARRLLGCFERVKKCRLGGYGPPRMRCFVVHVDWSDHITTQFCGWQQCPYPRHGLRSVDFLFAISESESKI